MRAAVDLQREIEGLRNRISRLSAAILRISASLDLDTVLKEIVDSARSLTGARCAIITPADAAGEPQAFVSSGFTAEEHARLATWSNEPRLLEHFRDLEIPLRLNSLPAALRAPGIASDLISTDSFQCTPLRHRGQHLGIFLLAGKKGEPGFTDTEEELLVLFASQAATAIANARTYRDERRARADLEALIETSPVGVIVLRRQDRPYGILEPRGVGASSRGCECRATPLEALLEVLTYRRDDGREVALDALPLAEALGSGETVRSEEIELSVPDGRRVRVAAQCHSDPIRGWNDRFGRGHDAGSCAA